MRRLFILAAAAMWTIPAFAASTPQSGVVTVEGTVVPYMVINSGDVTLYTDDTNSPLIKPTDWVHGSIVLSADSNVDFWVTLQRGTLAGWLQPSIASDWWSETLGPDGDAPLVGLGADGTWDSNSPQPITASVHGQVPWTVGPSGQQGPTGFGAFTLTLSQAE